MARPRKPTALKAIEGGRGHRTKAEMKRTENEPQPAPIRPEMPDFLDKRAQQEWNALVPELESIGVLTKVDGMTFAGYCQAVSDVIRLTESLRVTGETTEAPSGYIQQRPEVTMLNKAWDRLDKFARQLGIGAEHRSHIEVKKDDAGQSPLDKVREATRRTR